MGNNFAQLTGKRIGKLLAAGATPKQLENFMELSAQFVAQQQLLSDKKQELDDEYRDLTRSMRIH